MIDYDLLKRAFKDLVLSGLAETVKGTLSGLPFVGGLTVALCEVEAEAGGTRKTVALMTATLASVRGKGLSG